MTAKKQAPTKKTAKKATPVKDSAKAKKKAETKSASKPAKTRKNVKHETVSPETVLAFMAQGRPYQKKEIVEGCGGDDVAVNATIQLLRGEGKIVITGSTRDRTYSKP